MAMNVNNTESKPGFRDKVGDTITHLRDETLFPYTTAYAIGSAVIALTTRHYEALALTAHGVIESIREL